MLKRDRSRTPESNYSNSEVDALIRQMPLDIHRPETPCYDAGRDVERKSKRRRLSTLSPNVHNNSPPETVTPSYVLEEKVKLLMFLHNTNPFLVLGSNDAIRHIDSQAWSYATFHAQLT